MQKIITFLRSSRLAALMDLSAWILILPSLITLYAIDPALALTFGQWSIFALVLAGVAVMISRIIFPQINLHQLVKEVFLGNVAAGIVVASVVFFVSATMLALVLWAKA